MNFKRLILVAVIFSSVFAWAQQAKKDLISVDRVEFRTVKKGDIGGVGGPVLRGEIVLILNSVNPDSSASNPDWVRNIEVEIYAAWEDQKNKNAEMLLMSSKAKLFAIERGKRTSVSFYIPWESYGMYRLTKEPDYYKINLSYGGTPIELSAENAKTRLSDNLKNKQLRASFEAAVSKATANKGVLKPVNECSTAVQYYEYYGAKSNGVIPTYMDVAR